MFHHLNKQSTEEWSVWARKNKTIGNTQAVGICWNSPLSIWIQWSDKDKVISIFKHLITNDFLRLKKPVRFCSVCGSSRTEDIFKVVSIQCICSFGQCSSIVTASPPSTREGDKHKRLAGLLWDKKYESFRCPIIILLNKKILEYFRCPAIVLLIKNMSISSALVSYYSIKKFISMGSQIIKVISINHQLDMWWQQCSTAV